MYIDQDSGKLLDQTNPLLLYTAFDSFLCPLVETGPIYIQCWFIYIDWPQVRRSVFKVI